MVDRHDPEMIDHPGYQWKTSEDDAKRLHSWLRVHQLAMTLEEIHAGRYMAVQLWDGGTDGVVYESREAAIAHQSGDQNRYMYMRIMPDRLAISACDTLLFYGRRRYDAGYRPAGVHEGVELITPLLVEDLYADRGRIARDRLN